MMNRDFVNSIDTGASLPPATYTTGAEGASVDLRGADSAAIVVHTGAYTDGSHAVTLEESDDNATFTDVADADIEGDEPTIDASGDANTAFRFGYTGNKRYIRVVTAVSGTTNGAAYGASVVRCHLAREPQGYSVES